MLLATIGILLATVVLAYWTFQYVRVSLFKLRFKIYQSVIELLSVLTSPFGIPFGTGLIGSTRSREIYQKLKRLEANLDEAYFLFNDKKVQMVYNRFNKQYKKIC